MELDLTLVAAFVVLAEERHFGRAAQRLHLTTSALSKRVQRLERQLGVPLVVRDPVHGIRLTGAGLRFTRPACAVLEQAWQAARDARYDDGARQLRLGFPAGAEAVLSRLDLATARRDLRLECPQATLTAVPVRFGDLNQVLAEHRVDVLLTDSPMRRVGVVTEPLPLSDHRIAIVPPWHELADAGSVGVDNICGYPFLYAPHAPSEWMEPFWLADVRPRREARLVAVGASDNHQVLATELTAGAVMVNLASSIPVIPARLRVLTISGAAPVSIHAAYREGDHRAVLAPLFAALRRPVPGG
jgi:DNA-binding transcriptional LysR family regulator